MFLPEQFRANDEQISEMLEHVGAADLITATSQGLMCSHIPIVYDPNLGAHGAILGHIARANAQWKHSPTTAALAIIRGPEAYVSPSWYPSKSVDGRVVPTWNYSMIEARGEFIVHDDSPWKLDLVRRLTQKHEASRETPWSIEDAPQTFIDAQLDAIVGIELRIHRLEGKMKWSQNRDASDRRGVAHGLTADGLHEAAQTMHEFL